MSEDLSALLFNTIVLYGPTGSWKTGQAGEFAKYIYESTGKPVRYLTADGGGWATIQDLINVGIIEPWKVTGEEKPKLAIMLASKGGWPQKLDRGIRVGPMIVPAVGGKAEALKGVGGLIVEGWTSIASLVLRDAIQKGQKINEDVVSKFEEQEQGLGQMTFGASSRGHYSFAQNYILDMIKNYASLPVERVLFTALEGKGEDIVKDTIYGPQVAGKAITAIVPQHVGDCLHFEDYTTDKGPDPQNPKQRLVAVKVRAWFTKHPDKGTSVMWPAKARVVASQVPQLLSKLGKNGYFDLLDTREPRPEQHTLREYLHLQDELIRSGSEEARRWKEAADQKRKSA